MNTPFDPNRDADVRLVHAEAEGKVPDAVDELITEWQLADADEKSARGRKALITAELALLAPQVDACRTTRLRGEHLQVKLEYPDVSWNQSLLKEAWHAFPKFRDEFLGIATLRVKLRASKKAWHTTGPADFQAFLSMLKDAQREPMGMPRVTIEGGTPAPREPEPGDDLPL
jgi:hypothetical protein